MSENSTRLRSRVRTVLLGIGSLEATTAILIYLFVLVLFGTLYQVDHSIQETTARFFHAWLLFVGPMPLPSGQLVFAAAGANLLAATVTRIPLRWDRIGIWLAHAGLLMLVLGGVVARFATTESVLALAEGDADAYSYDLRRWDLVIDDRETGTERFALEGLPARTANPERLDGLEIDVLEMLPDAVLRRAGSELVESVSGAQALIRPDSRRDQPVPGVVVSVAGRHVLLHGGDPQPFLLNESVTLRLLPRRYPLPATIRLRRFEADFYDGTQTPRSFVSEVEVIEDDLTRTASISMNEPLRIGRYTLYQLGYDSLADFRNVSLFHVVRNPFRLLPYLVGLIVSAGLIIHALIHILRRWRATGARP